MKLSEVKTGTPVRITAFTGEEQIAEIWGKIRKSGDKMSQIDIYYYGGKSINLTESIYTLKATVFDNGEHELEMDNSKIKDIDNLDGTLLEKRETFRIYISKVVELTADDLETAALLVDLSEGGFRLAMRGDLSKDTNVTIHVEDESFDFSVSGTIVWVKHFDDAKSICGCKIAEGEDVSNVMEYIKYKQQALFDEIQQNIKENK